MDILPIEILVPLVRQEVNLSFTCRATYSAYLIEYRREIAAWRQWLAQMNGLPLDPLRTRWAIIHIGSIAPICQYEICDFNCQKYAKLFLYAYQLSAQKSHRELRESFTVPLPVRVRMNGISIVFSTKSTFSGLLALDKLVQWAGYDRCGEWSWEIYPLTHMTTCVDDWGNGPWFDCAPEILVRESAFHDTRYYHKRPSRKQIQKFIDHCGTSQRFVEHIARMGPHVTDKLMKKCTCRKRNRRNRPSGKTIKCMLHSRRTMADLVEKVFIDYYSMGQ